MDNLINEDSNTKNNNTKDNKEIMQQKQKNKAKILQHISDLENTIVLNQDCVSKTIPLLEIPQNQKVKLLKSIEKITEYFNKKKENRKKINEIQSKILINKQIIEEIKLGRDENCVVYKEQIANLSDANIKKASLIKQFQKKFSEVEIFIQRECQTEDHVKKYGKWKTFTIISFMKKNEDILKKKCFIEKEVSDKNQKLENLQKETENLQNNLNIDNNLDNLKKIQNYSENLQNLKNREMILMKQMRNFISDTNFTKTIVPTFKIKHISPNIEVHLNLLDPKEIEENMKKNELKEEESKKNEEENKENKENENDQNEGDEGEDDEKGVEIAPPEDDDWYDPENEGNISDIEKSK